MYEYKFVKIALTWTDKPREDYHQVIREYAEEGWRFIQIFAPATAGLGSPAFFELIFEKPVSSSLS